MRHRVSDWVAWISGMRIGPFSAWVTLGFRLSAGEAGPSFPRVLRCRRVVLGLAGFVPLGLAETKLQDVNPLVYKGFSAFPQVKSPV